MIISASRRTDLPAFYGEWTENRLREGRVLIPNPYNPHQVRDFRFSPEDIDCVVFWTKNAGPFLPRLSRIHEMGYSFYFQHTLTPYGRNMEPGLPDKREVLSNMKRIGEQLGPDGLIWRYDPIVINKEWSLSRHLETFDRFCQQLDGATGRCVISFVDRYSRMETRYPVIPPDVMEKAASEIAKIAGEYHLPVYACCEELDFTPWGIRQSACIDPVLVGKIAGHPISATKDRNQRKGCGCAASVDIGMYGACRHGCRYCYASGGRRLRLMTHDPDYPQLLIPAEKGILP